MAEIKLDTRAIFIFSDELKTGIDSIDRANKSIFETMRRIEAYLLQSDVNNALAQSFFHELRDQATYTFAKEEALMLKNQICKDYYNHHRLAHRGFEFSIGQGLKDILKSNLFSPDAMLELLNFLNNSLAVHIICEDKLLALQIQLIKEGTSPKSAFKIAKSKMQNEQGVLINALYGLIGNFHRKNELLSKTQDEIEERARTLHQELSKYTQELEVLSSTDKLTGLFNRRKAIEILEDCWRNYDESDISFAFIGIDLDFFKEVNDNFGHENGDLVLQKFAAKVQDLALPNSFFCRLGGDEFCLILSDLTLHKAVFFANEILKAVNRIVITDEEGTQIWHGAISLGVGISSPSTNSYEDVMRQADKYLYVAKNSGRNCVRSVLDEDEG